VNVGAALQQTNRHYGSRKIGLKSLIKIKLATASSALALLSACGGGGSSSAVQSLDPQGFWVGQVSTGTPIFEVGSIRLPLHCVLHRLRDFLN
jgi:hypothetical protein